MDIWEVSLYDLPNPDERSGALTDGEVVLFGGVDDLLDVSDLADLLPPHSLGQPSGQVGHDQRSDRLGVGRSGGR